MADSRLYLMQLVEEALWASLGGAAPPQRDGRRRFADWARVAGAWRNCACSWKKGRFSDEV